MHHKAILYSLDPNISFPKIDIWKEYDHRKYTNIKERCEKYDIHAMISDEPDVHYKILPIRPRVKILYYIWNIWLLNHKILGIVGPRAMSKYGEKVVETLFSHAQDYSIVTISGMAEGVDRLCHKLSHEKNIPTIAVLGWGIGRYMKRSERKIIDTIVADGGLVLSEYKLWEQPSRYTFPHRNRLIAWLSDVLFLPEAWEKSGSLITVDFALAMKKPVYASPGSIFSPTSAGILQCIAIWSVQAIVDFHKFFSQNFLLQHKWPITKNHIQLADQEQKLVSMLSYDQSIEIGQLLQMTWFDIQQCNSILSLLEIKGIVTQEVPGRYILL